MACKNCNLVKCGCADSYLTTPPPCPTPEDCPDVQPCSEVFDAQCIIYGGLDILCDVDVVVPANTPLSEALNSIVTYFCSNSALVLENDLTCLYGDPAVLEVVSAAGSTLDQVLVDIVSYYCSKTNQLNTDITNLTTIVNNINGNQNSFVTGSNVTITQTAEVNGCTTTNYSIQLVGLAGNIGTPIGISTRACPTPCEANQVTELNEVIPFLGQATDSFILCRDPENGNPDTAQILYTDLITQLNSDLTPGGGGGTGLTFKTIDQPTGGGATMNVATIVDSENTARPNSTYYVKALNPTIVQNVLLNLPYDGSNNGGNAPVVGDVIEIIMGTQDDWNIQVSSASANCFIGMYFPNGGAPAGYNEVNNTQSFRWLTGTNNIAGASVKLKCVETGATVRWIVVDQSWDLVVNLPSII